MPKKELDNVIIEQAIIKAKEEFEGFEDEDYIGNRAAFILWQHLGGIDTPENTTLADYKPLVKRFYQLAEDLLLNRYDEMSFTNFWSQFVEVFKKVKYFRRDYVELAKQRAKGRKEPLPELTDYDPIYQFLGAICYELQLLQKEGEPFYLSTYQAGEILDKDQKTGHRAMVMFVADEILKIHRVGDRNLASEYFYIGDSKRGQKASNNKTGLLEYEFEQKRRKSLQAFYESEKTNKK
jgi:hypothetical protein